MSRETLRESAAQMGMLFENKKYAYLKILKKTIRSKKNCSLLFVWTPCCVLGGKGIPLELQKLLLLASCELFLLLQVPTSFKLFLTVTSFCHLPARWSVPPFSSRDFWRGSGWTKVVCYDNRKSKGFGVHRTPQNRWTTPRQRLSL